MVPALKILSIGFLALTIFSILSLGYSLFIVLETTRAIRQLDVSLSDVDIRKNGSEVLFFLNIYNPSLVSLEVYHYSAQISLNNDEIGEPVEANPSLPLPANTEKSLTITLSPEDQVSSPGNWRLDLELKLETPLPRTGSFKTILV